MRILNNYSTQTINFKALKLDYKPKVYRFDAEQSKYDKEELSLLEFDFYNPDDINVLNDIADNWDYSTFAYNIAADAADQEKSIRINDVPENENLKIYAITSQKSSFNYLDYQKVLALCDIVKKSDKDIYVKYLEVNPDNRFNPYAEYKGVGTAFIDSLKNYNSKITLRPLNSAYVMEFYAKNGFRAAKQDKSYLEWEKE